MPVLNSSKMKFRFLAVFGCFCAFSCAHLGSEIRHPAAARLEPSACTLDSFRETFTSALATFQKYGILKPSETKRLAVLKTDALAARLTALLPHLYFEADALKRDFDRKIREGKTVTELSRPGKGYAHILAARILWEELNHSLQSYARERLLKAKEAAPLNGVDSVSIHDEARAIEKFFSNALSKTTDDVLLQVLSFADLRDYLVNADQDLSACVSGQDLGDGRVDATPDSIVDAARKYAEKPLDRAVFKTKTLSIGSLTSDRIFRTAGEKIQPVLNVSAPGNDDAVIYKPDSGSVGNVRGDLFPKNVWALTYDDGPGGKTTAPILDNLQELKTKATFFALTQQVEKYPDLMAREIKDGHALASHSYSHARFPDLSEAELKKELDDAVAALEAKSGVKVRFFRLPYGAGVSVKKIRDRIAGLGLIHVFWNVDTLDWQDKNPDTIYDRALTQMKNLGRGVILFHDIHPQSVIASKRVLQYILDPVNQLRSVTIPEIVDEQNKLVPNPEAPR